MTQSKRETERKYEAPSDATAAWLPDLRGVGGIESVVDQGTQHLDAVYYDTGNLQLARTAATLRRRTGGSDAGWHLKLPLSGDSREEVQAPLSECVPDALRELVLSRTRGADLRPVVRIRATRGVRQLVGSDGVSLAELSIDAVRAEPLRAPGTLASWSEIEVELATDTDHALLDAVDGALGEMGIGRARNSSKLARALEETGVGTPRVPDERAQLATPGSVGEEVLRYLNERICTLVNLDPAVRRGLPDAVHKMRTTCRRLRSVLRSYRSVLDREVTDPVREELKWLSGELGAERDQEVLRERLSEGIETLSGELVLGAVSARLQIWDAGNTTEARRRVLDALDSARYLALLKHLAALTERPPLRAKGARQPNGVMAKAILKEDGRLTDRMAYALEIPAGTERDRALHEARKAAKKTRYATEPARDSVGKPAVRLGKRVKAVQQVLGEHQDSVVARDALRKVALRAHAAGEPGFTWGLLYGREQAAADQAERELQPAWARASRRGLRKTFTN
ncbi:CYTH and CHAD domain-containing protein [Streptomyces sp. NPDC096934]|uniref:CYTH and CHAD domain-containing protein n=1 Tax=Streptomyces sp. NPDC096934 TaxID=3155551 RepID=UPI0033199A16